MIESQYKKIYNCIEKFRKLPVEGFLKKSKYLEKSNENLLYLFGVKNGVSNV